MIESITAINFKGESIELILTDPEKSGLIVKSITGLGPPVSTIGITDLATADGGVYNSARSETRNIVITLQMMDLPSVEINRHKTYRYFPVKKEVTLIIKTDERKLETKGYVESNEPDIFNGTGTEDIQISIVCPDPWMYEAGSGKQVYFGVQPLFEFSFDNDSVTDNLLEFGEIIIDNFTTIDYEGDVDTGFVLSIHLTSKLPDDIDYIIFYNTDTLERIAIDLKKIKSTTGGAFGLGDEIIISTKRGDKYVKFLRSGVFTNGIGFLTRDSGWPQLTIGPNVFRYDVEGYERRVSVIMTYKDAYGGV